MKSPTPLPSHLGARRLIHVFLGAILLIGTGQLYAQNNQPPPITEANIPELEAMLTQEIQQFVDRQSRLPGQSQRITVQVTVDASTSDVLIDLGIGYIPRGDFRMSEELNDKMIEVSQHAIDILSGIVTYRMLGLRFDGKRARDIFPDDYSPERPKQTSERAQQVGLDLIVVSPGHGYYYHHGSQSWVFQRPEPYAGTSNVHEDLVTPAYSDTLGSLLLERSHESVAAVANTRRTTDNSLHPESGHPWWTMGTRYVLKELYPDNPSLWNMFPNGTAPNRFNLREYDEDIRSRPEYANFLGANLMISLHTDAAPENPNARGTRVFAEEGDSESFEFARNVACHMKEQITSTPGYTDFNVQTNPVPSNHGENTRANMPSILIELGFATNLQDAAALQDPVFHSAAMRGVEKGYRMHREGKECTTFAVTRVDDVSLSHGETVPVPIYYDGNPQYPLTRHSRNISCATCQPTALTFQTGESPISVRVNCRNTTSSPTPHHFEFHLVDADGVRTQPFQYTVTCNPLS